jgi:PadR family transcriptional regulator, regulatory protein AphA
MKRKAIRLTGTSYAVLAVVGHLGEATPYDLKQAIERSTQNFWQVPHTTAYDEPARLAAGGYLSERREEGGRRRKRYALTEAGRAALAAWAAEPSSAAPQIRDEGVLKIFAGGDPEPVATARRAWHAAKLAEFEALLQAVPPDLLDGGPARSLRAGIAYHRAMLAAIEELVAAPAAP